MEKAKESELMSRAQSGDAEAFGRIYDLYSPKLYRFIYFKVHHQETAQDLLSDTFMKSLKSLDRFDVERGTVSSWLYSIARNTVIDHYRKTRPNSNLEDAWDLSSPASAESDAELRMKIETVKEHLVKLSVTEREIVTMRVWDEMTHREIAAALGKSEDACKVAFSRAVKKLRAAMPLGTFLLLFANKL